MRESSPSPFSAVAIRSSSPWLLLLVVLVPLLVVSFVVSGADFQKASSWFSSPSSCSSAILDVGSGTSKEEEHGKLHTKGIGEGRGELLVSNSSSGQDLHESPQPVAPPKKPVTLFKDFELDDVLSPPRRVQKRDTTLERLELGLQRARAAIRDAIQNPKRKLQPDRDYVPQGPTYKNAYAFHRSYLEMEKLFKVYVYEEGKPPIFHDGPDWNLYTVEGRFIHTMEMEKRLRTKNPDEAHVFFLPFSIVNMVVHIYKPNSYDLSPLKQTIVDYVNLIAGKYPYWNRGLGADHFMLSCHDWGPIASHAVPDLQNNSIRVQCNANTSEGFEPFRDVSLPEIRLMPGLEVRITGRLPAPNRQFLAFFAGGNHGPVRPTLIKHWKGRDHDIQVHEHLPEGVSYQDMMKKSKFCICPSGYEVASPRIVEAIYLECIPVLIAENYALPFDDVLDWKSFSVELTLKDIPNLKEILTRLSSGRYMSMQRSLRMAQRHFVVNNPPERFDVFYMILHSIWLRRLHVHIPPS